MEKTNNIYQKLHDAREVIRKTKFKKDGFNDYGKYSYFTPEQVEELVADACEKTKTICLTSLKQDQFGYYQSLEFRDLEGSESISFELRTEKPSITATNDTQKMGGMDTYSERYIKMKTFNIKDNNIDFDAKDNSPVVQFKNELPPPVRNRPGNFKPKASTEPTYEVL